jgi:hypothetical protein
VPAPQQQGIRNKQNIHGFMKGHCKRINTVIV